MRTGAPRLLRYAVSVTLAVFMAAGCATSRGDDEVDQGAADNSLHAAAEVVDPELRSGFADSFAGLTIDYDRNVLIIYRIPNGPLEDRVEALVDDVDVEFRDAAYSLAQMEVVIEQIAADTSYWRGEGIHINGAAPQADGSGVVAFVAEATVDTQQRLQGRYPTVAVSVEERNIVPPTAGPLPSITVSSGWVPEPRSS